MKKGKTTYKKIPLSKLKQGPVIHKSLPFVFIARMLSIYPKLEEVMGMTFQEFEEGFHRDHNPERELMVWQAIADCYVEFQKEKFCNDKKKKAVFHFLLAATAVIVEFTDEPDLSARDKQKLYNMLKAALSLPLQPVKLDTETGKFL